VTARRGFRLHPGAAQDISEIWEYIARDNIETAARVRERILQTIRDLVPFPYQGHKRPDLTSKPLRFKAVWDYLIAYAPEETPLLVIAVIHGRRNPRVIGAVLRSREN
jgi:plasmid stabilization system protein ParE